MFDEIDAIFNVKGKPVIFTWGDTIYNPAGIFITPELRAHEEVHFVRQTGDTPAIEAWWKRYLIDEEFRLAEELPAHRAEFQKFCQTHKDRNARNKFLTTIAARLAGPLYGGLLTLPQARTKISS